MNRSAVAAVLAVLAVGAVVGVGVTTADSVPVKIPSVEVTPQSPEPGEQVSFAATVVNEGNNDYEINSVAIRKPDPFEELVRVDQLGVVPGGGEVKVPLTTTFDESGTHTLRVWVYGEYGAETVNRAFPVSLVVSQSGPQIDADAASDSVVGVDSEMTLTVSNGETTEMRNVEVVLDGDAEFDDPRRVVSQIPQGEDRTFSFTAAPTTTGGTVNATIRYVAEGGETREVERQFAVDADGLREEVGLSATIAGDGATPPIAATVSNLGNAPLSDTTLTVREADTGEAIARRAVDSVLPGTERRVAFNLSDVEATELTVTADYETGDRTGSVEQTLDYETLPGEVTLTGVDVERDSGKLQITGSASNVGLTPASAVVVRVLPAGGVEPARPFEEFFVGEVPSSDFASFELYATVDGADAIPIEVSYVVDGERRTKTTEVGVGSIDSAAESSQSQEDQSDDGGLPLIAIGAGAVVVVFALAGMGYAWRNASQ